MMEVRGAKGAKKVVISHFEMFSIVSQSSRPSFLQQCIENFIAMAIPKHLLTKKVVINHFEVLSVVGQSSKLSFLQKCIENLIAMAIPKHLLTRRSIQHDQLG